MEQRIFLFHCVKSVQRFRKRGTIFLLGCPFYYNRFHRVLSSIVQQISCIIRILGIKIRKKTAPQLVKQLFCVRKDFL